MEIGELPNGVELVRTTPTFDHATVPAGLLNTHRVADDVWGRVIVKTGSLRVHFDDGDETHTLGTGSSLVLAPGRPHHVEPIGAVEFAVEFHRHPTT